MPAHQAGFHSGDTRAERRIANIGANTDPSHVVWRAFLLIVSDGINILIGVFLWIASFAWACAYGWIGFWGAIIATILWLIGVAVMWMYSWAEWAAIGGYDTVMWMAGLIYGYCTRYLEDSERH